VTVNADSSADFGNLFNLQLIYILVVAIDSKSGRNMFFDVVIQHCQIGLNLVKNCRQHSAADIHADDIGNNVIIHLHGKTDHYPVARMTVRHDGNVGIFKSRMIEKG